MLIPGIAVTVRRLHDTGRSGWWILISLVPVIGWIVLLVFMVLEATRGTTSTARSQSRRRIAAAERHENRCPDRRGDRRPAARVFHGPGDVSLGHALRTQDVRHDAGESGGDEAAGDEPGPLQRLSCAGLAWGLLLGTAGDAIKISFSPA